MRHDWIRTPQVYVAALLFCGGITTATTASAQSLDLGMNCLNDSGQSMMTGPTTMLFTRTYAMTCAFQYQNDTGGPLPNVELQISSDLVTLTKVAPDLPDGVEGLANNEEQIYGLWGRVSNRPGNPRATIDVDTQVITMPVGTLPNLTTAEASTS